MLSSRHITESFFAVVDLKKPHFFPPLTHCDTEISTVLVLVIFNHHQTYDGLELQGISFLMH